MTSPVLTISGLRVELTHGAAIIDAVELEVNRGEILGLVGESGSGKTTTALAILGFARPGARIAAGSVRIQTEELVGRSESELRRLRGRLVSYVPQDPSASLNPSLRVGVQVLEIARARGDTRWTEADVSAALARVHLPHDRDFLRRFPHQLSGGQQQRVALAIALAMDPSVVILDEPTTGLDVVTQRRILEEIARLRDETGTAMVYVSHDLAAVGSVADRIAVMYAGRIVELANTQSLLGKPLHPYTHGLVSSVPDHMTRSQLRGIKGVAVGAEDRPAGCAFAPRCGQVVESCLQEQPELLEVRTGRRVRCTEWSRTPTLVRRPGVEAPLGRSSSSVLSVEELWAVYASAAGGLAAARSVSFSIDAGETLALVGESGSGKTTIARCIAGLHPPASGEIRFDGQPLAALARKRPLRTRRDIQLIFQSPYESLSPRQRIEDQIARPARQLRQLSREQARGEARSLLERVRLPATLARRFPAELSGGERQRVAIARALAAGPRLLVCDEITSALDVSVQAAVVELMMELRSQLGLALLFISHDLGVVASMADRAVVLEQGEVRATGSIGDLLTNSSDPYTRELIEAAPRLPGSNPGGILVEPMS